MMRTRMLDSVRRLGFAAVMALAGCEGPAGEVSESERAAIASMVEQVWADMMAGARALDPARIRAGYVEKPIVVINGLIIDDFDRGQFDETRRWIRSLRQLEVSYDHVRLEVLSPNAAVATMNHLLRWTDSLGVAGEWNSAWTAVFRRIDGHWKIVHSHESTPPPTPT